jgi:rsbT co-antagonist protein RsbR
MTGETADFDLANIMQQHQAGLVELWLKAQPARLGDLMAADMRKPCEAILADLAMARSLDFSDPSFASLKQRLEDVSRSFALRRVTPSEIALFIFSLKDALSQILRQAIADPLRPWQSIEATNRLIDRMGIHTLEAYMTSREATIREQQRSILELSTPVVQLWDNILALPLVGTIDTMRTQQIMESLLEKIVETGSQVVIMDITGVPLVDTTVARHLLQTVAAARLLGAEVILVGISPRIAQTLVHLGVDLGDVVTRVSMATGLALALARTNQKVVAM